MKSSFLSSVLKQFEYYRRLGDKTIAQLNEEELKKEFVQDSNYPVNLERDTNNPEYEDDIDLDDMDLEELMLDEETLGRLSAIS